MTDYKTWADEDLATARDAIATEIERRALLAQADQLAADLAARIAAASGKGQGEEWVQPTGAHDSYPSGAKVTYQGKTYIARYVSTVDVNVWTPGVYGWKLDTTGQTTTMPRGGNA